MKTAFNDPKTVSFKASELFIGILTYDIEVTHLHNLAMFKYFLNAIDTLTEPVTYASRAKGGIFGDSKPPSP